jgi:hypothetical protein
MFAEVKELSTRRHESGEAFVAETRKIAGQLAEAIGREWQTGEPRRRILVRKYGVPPSWAICICPTIFHSVPNLDEFVPSHQWGANLCRVFVDMLEGERVDEVRGTVPGLLDVIATHLEREASWAEDMRRKLRSSLEPAK